MGAFFLVDSKRIAKSDSALSLFREMGFSSPRIIEVDDIAIYVYPKIATHNNNICTKKGTTIISVGVPIYKGMNYCDSLSALLNDYLDHNISYHLLFGQYTLIFCHAGKIEILRDPLGSKHIFTDGKHRIVSSHMLPLCQCIEENLHINKMALYEKYLTGFIMPPNTLFNEIIQIDDGVETQMNELSSPVSFIQPQQTRSQEPNYPSTCQKCLADQANELRHYFEAIKNYSEIGVDIGLSGGYDSRLVLACLRQYTRKKIHLHSHSTENVHKEDLKIAYQMADCIGEPCHTVATKKLNHCDGIDEILRKSVLYFDGRSSYSIGGCGEVYTAPYRCDSTEKNPFTLTGVGGELYRNVFDIGKKKIRFDSFMRNKVFSADFRRAVSDELYQDISQTVIDKAAKRLNIDKHTRQTKAIAHRYYCEIMMPDGQGVALDAYNQVSCCAAPFMEPHIIYKGYESIPFHRSGGEFEGLLIAYIDSALAALPSSYGYPIGKRTIKARLKEGLRTYIPVSLWNRIAAMKNRGQKNSDGSSLLNDLYANCKTMEDAYAFMIQLFPEIHFEYLLQSSENIRRIQFIAMTLYYFRERIQIK